MRLPQMPPQSRKINLIYFVILTLLIVGLVPHVLTGWFLSDRSGKELRDGGEPVPDTTRTGKGPADRDVWPADELYRLEPFDGARAVA